MRNKANYPDSQTHVSDRPDGQERSRADVTGHGELWMIATESHVTRHKNSIRVQRLQVLGNRLEGVWVTVWSTKPLENAFIHRYEAPVSLAKKMHTLFQLKRLFFPAKKYICQRVRIVNYAQMLILGPWWGLSTNPKS